MFLRTNFYRWNIRPWAPRRFLEVHCFGITTRVSALTGQRRCLAPFHATHWFFKPGCSVPRFGAPTLLDSINLLVSHGGPSPSHLQLCSTWQHSVQLGGIQLIGEVNEGLNINQWLLYGHVSRISGRVWKYTVVNTFRWLVGCTLGKLPSSLAVAQESWDAIECDKMLLLSVTVARPVYLNMSASEALERICI